MISGDSTNPYVSPNAAGEADPASADTPRDRSLGLALFGTLQLLIAGFFALMVPFLALSLLMPQPGHAQPRWQGLVPALAGYAMLAAAFATLGVGSILARRWARALTLVLSWLWLAMGLLTMALVLLLMGGMFAAITQQSDIPPSALLVMQLVTVGVLGGMYVVLPAAFEAMGLSPEELDMIRRTQFVETMPMAAMSAVTTVAMLGYLLWVRRHFSAARTHDIESEP